jgi:hypothetical protein
MLSIGHVVPVKKRIQIDIPAAYINKEIEILIIPIEKPRKEKHPKESILSLQGILGDVDYEPAMKKKAWEAAVEDRDWPVPFGSAHKNSRLTKKL